MIKHISWHPSQRRYHEYFIGSNPNEVCHIRVFEKKHFILALTLRQGTQNKGTVTIWTVYRYI